jgi:hypothetical protein
VDWPVKNKTLDKLLFWKEGATSTNDSDLDIDQHWNQKVWQNPATSILCLTDKMGRYVLHTAAHIFFVTGEDQMTLDNEQRIWKMVKNRAWLE